jgi:hypothetical protein
MAETWEKLAAHQECSQQLRSSGAQKGPRFGGPKSSVTSLSVLLFAALLTTLLPALTWLLVGLLLLLTRLLLPAAALLATLAALLILL